MSAYHSRSGGRRRATLLRAGAAAVLVAAAGAYVVARRVERESPPRLQGAPLRVGTADGDAMFLLTTHARRYVSSSRGSSPRVWFERYLDVWRFDPATATPVWRRRLLTERGRAEPAAFGATLLGAHGGTVWVHARGPIAVALADGRTLGDADTIAARSPALRGAMPTDPRYFVLAADGLRVTATDASVHRVDPATLAASPAAREPAPGPRATPPAPFFADATRAFMARGLTMPARWIGLMTAEEGARFRDATTAVAAALAGEGPGRAMRASHEAARLAPPTGGLDAPARLRLWGARIARVSAAPPGWTADLPNDWGTRAAFADIAPLPASPEFLSGGLLHAGGTPAVPLWVRDPDGVFVLHRDRLGESGRLQVTRVAGPGGGALWDARLPLSVLQAVLPGAPERRTIVLVGREYTPADRTPRDPYHEAHEQVVSVDVATGAVRAFDLTVDGRTTPVVP